MVLRAFILTLALTSPFAAWADADFTREALSRAEEAVELQVEGGRLVLKDIAPVLLVSVQAKDDTSAAWYSNEALAAMMRVFGKSAVRMCEACMKPRVYSEAGRLEANSTALDVAELLRLDEIHRGNSAPARTAVWLDETPHGVSLRIIDLSNSQVLFARNFDPSLKEFTRTTKYSTVTKELSRRLRGDSLTHTFIDIPLYGSSSVAAQLSFLEQWGDDNLNLSGVVFTAADPLLGVGVVYFRILPQFWNTMMGFQVVMNPLVAVLQGIAGPDVTFGNQSLLTAAVTARVPIYNTNTGVFVYASSNGVFSFGVSLLNLTFLPFLP